jgi:4-amino-4-deoxy-L-arabinose transferase-like glycosyltransferase
MILKNNLKKILILSVLSLIFLMLGNNILSLTNPDEVFYAGTAQEMAQHKTWSVPYLFGQPQFEKPIFIYWLIRFGFLVFGSGAFGARFFPALFGMIGVIAVYIFSLYGFSDKKKSFLCALITMSSVLYIGLSRTVFTDLIFSVFILFSMMYFYFGYTRKNLKAAGIILFFIFSAFAVLTKGPLGLLIPMLTVFIFLGLRKDLGFLCCRSSIWGSFLFLLVALPWYIFIIKQFGSSFISEFFYNDHVRRLFEAEHHSNDTWWFYPGSIFLSIFPWSIFSVASFFALFKKLKQRDAKPIYSFLLCWIIAVFFIFQFAHSKLISYIFPLFPAVALLTGDFMLEASRNKKQLFFGLFVATSVFFMLLPVGIVCAAFKYPMYLSSSFGLYAWGSIFILAVIAQIIIARTRQSLIPTFLAGHMIILLIVLFIFNNTVNEYASSKPAADYLESRVEKGAIVLCSKTFVRGIRFYTGSEVAVVNLGGSTNFFSPHPIPYLNTNEKVAGFLENKQLTYGVLNKSTFRELKSLAHDTYQLDLLKQIGDEYIVVFKHVS